MRNKILGIYAAAMLLGIVTGVVGSVFQLAILASDQRLAAFYHFAAMRHWPVALLSMGISSALVFIAWYLVVHFAPEAAGSGIQEIEGALIQVRPISWRRLLPVKFIGGVFAISAKMVLGREGPTIQMGGNLGEMFGELFRMTREHRNTLIAAGSAAGLAAAFNAPLAAVLFILEEMREEFHFSFSNFQAVAICSVAATIILHLIMGSQPAIPMSIYLEPSLGSMWIFLIFGVITGVVGLFFNTILMKCLYAMDYLNLHKRGVFAIIVGGLVGYLTYRHHAFVGGGYEIIENALLLQPPWKVLILLLVIRFFTTMLSYSSGVPGGIFAPMLALGTILGLSFSYLLPWMTHDLSIQPGIFVVLGMGGLFAAAVRAPVTGIVLVVEMTNNYSLILPLMITCLTATTIVQLANNPPIYVQLLQKILKKEGIKFKVNY